MKESRKSLQTKFIVLITSALLTLSFLVGGFSLWIVNKLSKQDSRIMLDAVCNEQALRLDMQLQSIQQAVDILYNYAYEELESAESLRDDEYRLAYIAGIEKLALDIAENTEGVRTVYFRTNPEIYGPTDGFFLVNENNDGEFIATPVTNLVIYEKSDVEHVGWYYQPVEAGKPIWMSPYYNSNIDGTIISYVIPFFCEGETVGVIGMDMDFTTFVDLAQEAAVYENGRANLVDMSSGTVFYREADDDEKTIRTAEVTDKLHQDLQAKNASGDELLWYKSGDEEYMMAFQTVDNGMRYILYSPVKEINKERNQLLATIIVLTTCILALFIIFMAHMTRRIIHFAFTDALTGVKNKACYDDYVQMLEGKSQEENPYAVVVFDVNSLKPVNDTYGHEAGDALLTSVCKYICDTFSHSPIFRIGGDEFVAILEGTDYENREALAAAFEEHMAEHETDEESHRPISVAYGMADSCGELDSYEMVFRRADEKMYEKKRQMKE